MGNNIRQILLAAAMGLTVSACQTPAQMRASNDAQDDTKCKSFGASPGSVAYYQCRMTMNQNREIAENQSDRVFAQNMRTGAMLMKQ